MGVWEEEIVNGTVPFPSREEASSHGSSVIADHLQFLQNASTSSTATTNHLPSTRASPQVRRHQILVAGDPRSHLARYRVPASTRSHATARAFTLRHCGSSGSRSLATISRTPACTNIERCKTPTVTTTADLFPMCFLYHIDSEIRYPVSGVRFLPSGGGYIPGRWSVRVLGRLIWTRLPQLGLVGVRSALRDRADLDWLPSRGTCILHEVMDILEGRRWSGEGCGYE